MLYTSAEITALAIALPDSDREFLKPILQECDIQSDWLASDAVYRYYRAIARTIRTQLPSAPVVLEIGVRYGYSAYALLGELQGASFIGFDNESYVPNSLRLAENNLLPVCGRLVMHRLDTSSVEELPCGTIHVAHVDGGHQFDEALHDMMMCWAKLEGGGIMIVDDIHFLGEVKRAVCAFGRLTHQRWCELNSFRGLALFTKS